MVYHLPGRLSKSQNKTPPYNMQEQQPVYTSGLLCFSTSPRQATGGDGNPYHTRLVLASPAATSNGNCCKAALTVV